MSFLLDHFERPAWLWLVLLLIPVVWLGWRSLATLEPVRRWTAIALRGGVLVVLVLMLAGLQAVQRHDDLTVVALLDRSESVRQFVDPAELDEALDNADQAPSLDRWQLNWLARAADDRRPDDRLGLVSFDGRPSVQAMPSQHVDLDLGTLVEPVPGADTASAIRTALALLPPDSAARLVLLSDGNDGSATGIGRSDEGAALLAAAREAAAANVSIDVVPLAYRLHREVMVEGVYAPVEARQGQTLAVRVVLRGTHRAEGSLHLMHDGQPVAGSEPIPVLADQWSYEGEEGDEATRGQGDYVLVRTIEVPAAHAGANRFRAIFEPADPDQDRIAANNEAQAITLVHGEGQLLFVDNVGGQSGAILPQALQQRGIAVRTIGPRLFPTELSQLQRYDAVVLQNVAADQLTRPQDQMLARYVHDLGGGLIKLGGPEGFGAGGWANTAVDRVLPVESEIPSREILPSGALALVIDRSGSMSANVAGTGYTRQEIANEAAVLAMQTLFPEDLIGVVAFDRQASWVVDLQPARDEQLIAEQIRSIRPGGGTHIYPGIVEAYEALAALDDTEAAAKHIIVLTDGMDNPGLQNDYPGISQSITDAGITLSTVGVGEAHQIDSDLLQDLADWGDGNFYHVTDPAQLPQIFIREAQTVHTNLVRERAFNPTLQATGSPIMQGFTGFPPLQGLVVTHHRDDPRVFTPMLGPEGEPLFAHWQVGLGRAAAFTSDATNRWATAWLGWGGYGDFWTRVARLVARPPASRQFDLVSSIQDGQLHVRLDGGPEMSQAQNPRGALLMPDGDTDDIELVQTGPGIFEGQAPAGQTGSYIVSLFVQDARGAQHTVFDAATRATSEQLRRFRSNEPLLEQVAELTGGRMLSASAADVDGGLFERTERFVSRSSQPLWRQLLVLLLVLFLLDVACRRVAWDAGATLRWVREKGAAMLAPRRVQSEQTLGALKRTRDQTGRKLGADATAPAPGKRQPAASDEPTAIDWAPRRDRKFDADTTAPSEDLADNLGGARQSKPNAAAATDNTEQDDDSGSAASRLRAAKHRARQQLEDD